MARQRLKKIAVAFYRTAAGAEPVKAWLWSLPDEDRKIIGDDLRTVQYGWPLGLRPQSCRSLGKGLWEVRSDLKDRIGRVLFFAVEDRIGVVHGFIKKTQKTPLTDIALARKRTKEMLNEQAEKPALGVKPGQLPERGRHPKGS
jgi:phage-related protein